MSFVKANWKEIIRSGFVFQMKPLHVAYKPIVVYIYPSTNGKANNSIIQKLFEIKSILHNHRIETVSFSFDGDNAYKNLNLSFFESFINRMIKQNTIPLGRMISIRISPDYSHIVKRLRYRILSHRIHMGFTMDSPVIDMNEVQCVLKNIPPIVFSDIPLTKMHDVLPLTLFSLSNFVQLFEKKMFFAAAFWFPISISIAAKNAKNIGYQNRMFLLQTSLWFLVLFKKSFDEFKNSTEAKILNERKYKENVDVLPYTIDILIEFINCIYSDISLIKKYKNVDLDRNSTGPLEHTFGRSRVKCNNIHTLNKFIDSVGEINHQALNQICEDIEKVKGRSLNFGVTVEDKTDDDDVLFVSTPQQISYEFLCMINICSDKKMMQSDFDNLFLFVEFLKDLIDEKKPKSLTINSITLHTQQTKTITQRMSFSITKEKNLILQFFKIKKPKEKIDKAFIHKFYQKLVESVPMFPLIDEKTPKKQMIIDHLDENFFAFNENYEIIIKDL